MWNVPLLFLLYIINVTVYGKRNTSVAPRYNVSSAVTNYIHILYPVLIKKNNRKNHYQEKASSELNKSEQTQLPVSVNVSFVNQYSSHPACHHTVEKPSGPCPELIS